MCRSKKTKENDSPRLDSPKVKPIVFVNNPIADEKHDAIGFGAYVNTAKAAIDEGATTIGLIAGYGTGKLNKFAGGLIRKRRPSKTNLCESLELF